MRARIIQGLSQLYKSGSLNINEYATIKCQPGKRLRVDIKPDGENLRIEFVDPQPLVEFHKLFVARPKLNAITLTGKGVDIDLAMFPDTSVTYEDLEKFA